ncbi:hypothetical protein GQ43DRAFT_45630 [Delitschia confertaspora ATCC 74209]|uniref:Metallo-beta-lactamase domain protein n=1 Tax=Delitschia confertaspora ATCC 74209 TaxID=1513339 RepID=A0A9P4JKL5_9PLEO|nr:hypothetical protein GQ43DRAFT_45630 [Delitschia confertaspora ATCC 74209]
MPTSDGETIILPAPSPTQTYVTVSALDAGHITLPERLFITDADPQKKRTVPSMAFLIQHPLPEPTNIIFDLGVKRDIESYTPAQHAHILQRQPVTVHPDVTDSLQKGGLHPSDIHKVILSHVHWDHIGTPSDFPNSEFFVGSGTQHILAHGDGPYYPAELFHADELPANRTFEFPPTANSEPGKASEQQIPHTWYPLAGFPAVIDFFNDGSIYIVDARGHMSAHLNLLLRVGPKKWVYLGGDCCHDPRILTGEKGIAMYDDGRGGVRSVHVDLDSAAEMVKRVRLLMGEGRVVQQEKNGDRKEVVVEVVVAHDEVWRKGNAGRFWPGRL